MIVDTRCPSFFTSLYTGSDPDDVLDTRYASNFGSVGSCAGCKVGIDEKEDVEANVRRSGVVATVGSRRSTLDSIFTRFGGGQAETAFPLSTRETLYSDNN